MQTQDIPKCHLASDRTFLAWFPREVRPTESFRARPGCPLHGDFSTRVSLTVGEGRSQPRYHAPTRLVQSGDHGEKPRLCHHRAGARHEAAHSPGAKPKGKRHRSAARTSLCFCPSDFRPELGYLSEKLEGCGVGVCFFFSFSRKATDALTRAKLSPSAQPENKQPPETLPEPCPSPQLRRGQRGEAAPPTGPRPDRPRRWDLAGFTLIFA